MQTQFIFGDFCSPYPIYISNAQFILNKSRPALLNVPDGILYNTIDYELFKLCDVANDYVVEEFNVICADNRLKV